MNAKPEYLRVLVVEDEFIIADEIATIVEGAGHSVLGPIASVEEATTMLTRDRPDFAIIDANLRGQSSSSLAQQLNDMDVPFCVCTGYRLDDLQPTFGPVTVVQKPVRASTLVGLLDKARAARTLPSA